MTSYNLTLFSVISKYASIFNIFLLTFFIYHFNLFSINFSFFLKSFPIKKPCVLISNSILQNKYPWCVVNHNPFDSLLQAWEARLISMINKNYIFTGNTELPEARNAHLCSDKTLFFLTYISFLEYLFIWHTILLLNNNYILNIKWELHSLLQPLLPLHLLNKLLISQSSSIPWKYPNSSQVSCMK